MEFKKKIRKDSVAQTIRFSGKTYNNIYKIAEKNRITFNSVVNQILENFFKNEGEE